MAPYLRSHARREPQSRVLRSATRKDEVAAPAARTQPRSKAKKKVPKKTQQTPQDQADQSTLLNLPPEIRNIIYTWTLQEPQEITVTRDTKLPALLSTCKQSRQECTKLYFASNTFLLHVRQFDASLLLKWCELTRSMCGDRTGRTSTQFMLHHSKNFKNLRQWCRWVHEGRDVKHPRGGKSKISVIVSTATGMAKACRGIPWVACDKQLGMLRRTFDVLEGGWIAKQG